MMKNRVGLSMFILLFLLPGLNVHATDIPMLMNYQGNVTDTAGIPVNGDGFFKFAIVNEAGNTAYWVNDGATMDGTEPTTAITIPVSDGRFAVKLGDTDLVNMAAISPSVFDNTKVYLRVWFSIDEINFEKFTTDMQVVSTGFAFKAQSVGYDGLKNNTGTYMAYKPNNAACEDDQILTWDAANSRWSCSDINIAAETDPTVAASVKDGVSWPEVTGIPAGFADGTDDGIISESDPTVAASVKDGVSWPEVTGIPAGFADGTDDGIISESDPTVAASVKDGVSWPEVTGIPAGFADGVDDTGDSNWTVSGNDMSSTISGNVGIGTTSFSPARLNVLGGDQGIYGKATAGSDTLRPYGIVADVATTNITNTGGGFLTEIRTSNTPNVGFVYGGRFSVNDDGNKNARGITIDINNAELNDYGLEIIVSEPGYAISSGESGKIYFAGNVGIGNPFPGYRLEVTGGDVNTVSGGYRDGGSCVAGTCASDRSLKTNINPLSDSLEKLTHLEPVSYEFIDPKYGPGRQDGLIAQDVEEIFPEWVSDSEEGYKSIKYGLQIQMHLIQAIKELKIENDNLKIRILALENTL